MSERLGVPLHAGRPAYQGGGLPLLPLPPSFPPSLPSPLINRPVPPFCPGMLEQLSTLSDAGALCMCVCMRAHHKRPTTRCFTTEIRGGGAACVLSPTCPSQDWDWAANQDHSLSRVYSAFSPALSNTHHIHTHTHPTGTLILRGLPF